MDETTASIQEALFMCGCYPGKVDGKMGPKTKAGIKQFQEQAGLSADGVCGPNTKAALATKLGEVAARAKGLQGFFAGGGSSALDDM